MSGGPRELLTFRKMAGRLGWGETRAAGRKLARAITARERELGKRIATRSEGGHRRVTESALTRWMPELKRSKVDELAANFRSYLTDIDAKIAQGAAAYIAENVDPRLDELFQRDEIIAKNLDALGRRVAQIVTKNEPRKAHNRPTMSRIARES